MGEAIGQALPLAVGVALSPIPIVGVVLMLATPGRAPTDWLSCSGGCSGWASSEPSSC
jgi:hypothetical protein